MQKLESYFLEEKEKIETKLREMDQILYNRIDYIAQQIGNAFGKKSIWWSYTSNPYIDYDDRENEELTFNTSLSENKKFIELNFGQYRFIILDKNNNKIQLQDNIPTRWLFEDFEEELKNGKQAYLDFLEKTKENRLKEKEDNKARKDRIKENIKSKLSEEELKFLKMKLL